MSPDAWMFVALFAIGWLLYLSYTSGSLAAERREAQRLRRELAWRRARANCPVASPGTGGTEAP